MKKKVIGVILTYNSGPLLSSVYRRIPKGVLDQIIVVDDGSVDDIAREAAKCKIPLYTHPHGGYGANMMFGLKKARSLGADYVVEIHGDGQYDPKVIPDAVALVQKQKYDLLLGSRFHNWKEPLIHGMPWARYLANIGLSFIARVVLAVPLSEFHSGFRIYSKRFIDTVNLSACSRDHLFSFEIIAQARFGDLSIGEIPVVCDYRGEHTSISIPAAVIFSVKTFGVLYKYIGSIWGFKHSRLFPSKQS